MTRGCTANLYFTRTCIARCWRVVARREETRNLGERSRKIRMGGLHSMALRSG